MFRRVLAPRRLGIISAALVVTLTALLGIGGHPASAHRWGTWHWHKSGTQIVINNYITGGTQAQAEAARVDAWNKVSILYNYRVYSHSDVHIFDANSGNTGWIGLASLESVSGDHILHAHAQYNTYYSASSSYIQGVYCQEIYHTYGFDHDDTGSCMGLGYYANATTVLNQHNADDFYNLYRYH